MSERARPTARALIPLARLTSMASCRRSHRRSLLPRL